MSIFFASASEAIKVAHYVIDPIIYSLSLVGGLLCVSLLIISGLHYITSSGNPESLDRAKKIIRNSLIGLVIIISAASLTGILSHAYGSQRGPSEQHLPSLATVKPDSSSLGLVGVLIKAITGVLQNIVDTIGKPFIKALSFFTSSTPLMADNNSVFNLWLITTGIADALFVLVIVLIGYNVMSANVFGFDPIPNSWGNAATWAERAARDGYVVDHNPSVGSIMQISNVDGGLGHVAFVESVDGDGTWHISEMNVLGLDIVDYTAKSASAAVNYNFIHDKEEL